MEPIVLTDPAVTPDNELVFSIIGHKSAYWQRIMNWLSENHRDSSEVWRFYNDGKCWLFRTLKKKKTIFWLGVSAGSFRISFYLGDKAEALIEASDLPEAVKKEFREAKQSTFGRSLTIVVDQPEDAETVIQLMEIKLKLK